MSENITKSLIIEKLGTVYDPEIPVNIWDLGLVYDIEFTSWFSRCMML